MADDRKGERLDVALVVLYDTEGRLLLQHRTEDARVLPGCWAFFGGGIREGESPEQAVRREAKEEIGVMLRAPELFTEQDFRIGDTPGHMHLFIERYEADKAGLVLREGQGWGWFRPSETTGLRMIEHDRQIVRRIGEHLEGRT